MEQGSEVSVSPVGCPLKAEASRTSQPKRAMRPLQGSSATIEVAEGRSPTMYEVHQRIEITIEILSGEHKKA